MFAKKFRLPAKVQLNAYTVTPFFTFRFTKNDLGFNRYGFVVSKQVDKKATARNMVKRKIRAYLELMHQELKPGHDLLFIIKARAKDASRKELWEVIEKELKGKNLI